MSDPSDNSEPIQPLEANQTVMRVEIDELKAGLRELMTLVRFHMSNPTISPINRSDPSRPGPSQTYIPPTPQVPPTHHHSTSTHTPPPNPNQPPRNPNPPPFVPPYEPPPPSPRHHNIDDLEDDRWSMSRGSDVEYVGRRGGPKEEDDKGLWIDMPEFNGSLVPEEYLEWVNSMEQVFEYKEYSDEKRFKVTILKLKEYAGLWWRNLRREREKDDKSPIKTWSKLKRAMDKKFLPKNYKQQLYDRLHGLRQEKKSVAEYMREFEQLNIRCDIPEAKEHTIARFIGG